MTYRNLAFQSKAVDEMSTQVVSWLNNGEAARIVLQAPTGSGKTIMMARSIEAICESYAGKVVFFWIAPFKLETQGHESLDRYFLTSRTLSCVAAHDVKSNQIADRSIVFMNWSSIDKDTSLLVRDNERGAHIDAWIEAARTQGTKIVLVIDESHLHIGDGERARHVVYKRITPDIQIEVSATPLQMETPFDEQSKVIVDRDAVIEAGLIRRSVFVNAGAMVKKTPEGLSVDYDGTPESLIDRAVKRQHILFNAYLKELGRAVTPLILIQVPDKSKGGEAAIEQLKVYLFEKYGMLRGRHVATWLSEHKDGPLDTLADENSPVKVLFFNRAIATGWDCPRAQILIGLQNMVSESFRIQVLGRIIRSYGQRHYQDRQLNHAYFYTNLERLAFNADVIDFNVEGVQIIRPHEPVVLSVENWHARTNVNQVHLRKEVIRYIKGRASGQNGFELVRHHGSVTAKLIHNARIDDIDHSSGLKANDVGTLSLAGLQRSLDNMKLSLLHGFSDKIHGLKYLDRALKEVAYEALVKDNQNPDEKMLLETILHEVNRPFFEQTARSGIEDFVNNGKAREQMLTCKDVWQAPAISLSSEDEAIEFSRSLHPCYPVSFFSKTACDLSFARYLDSLSYVSWWSRNRDFGKDHLALPYSDNAIDGLLYPDFIVRLENGRHFVLVLKSPGQPMSGIEMRKHVALTQWISRCDSSIDGLIVFESKNKQWHACQGCDTKPLETIMTEPCQLTA